MIDFALTVRRMFWHGVSMAESVQTYLDDLTKFKDELNTMRFTYTHNLFGSDKLLKEIQELISREIKLCSFYSEYQERCASEPNFNQWIFKKKEDINPRYGWQEAQGDQWVKTNGKLKATIQFDRSGKRVKISLSFDNDSSALSFMDRYGENKIKPVHLKNETSIANKVAEFKIKADAYLSDHKYPGYCAEKNSINTLNKLLWINDSVDSQQLRIEKQ